LIAAVVLYLMGTGPIKGFALTLGIGIALSMFTALFVTKNLLKAVYTL
jgi:preprotein translocase subunit SecD